MCMVYPPLVDVTNVTYFKSTFLLSNLQMLLNFDFWVFHLLFTYLILWTFCFFYLFYIKTKIF